MWQQKDDGRLIWATKTARFRKFPLVRSPFLAALNAYRLRGSKMLALPRRNRKSMSHALKLRQRISVTLHIRFLAHRKHAASPLQASVTFVASTWMSLVRLTKRMAEAGGTHSVTGDGISHSAGLSRRTITAMDTPCTFQRACLAFRFRSRVYC
jgi:hypothetical protein